LSTSKYHHGDLRATLLDVTLNLVNEAGVGGLSLREVSRRAGVSHAAAYNHFADKAALIAALVGESFERFAIALREARDAGVGELDSLRRIGIAYVVFAHEHPTRFKLMFRPELTGRRPADPSDSISAGSYRVLVDAVDAALAAGVIAGDAASIVLASWSIVHGLAALIVDGPTNAFPATTPEIAAIADAMLAVLIGGVRAAA
jgi:AcrR family transcriptional regulator